MCWLLQASRHASMAFSLEARSPLLDHQLFEYAARLPQNMKIRNGVEKYLLKKLAERYLPHEIIYRPKMGFSIPVSRWIRDKFGSYLHEMCSNQSHPLWIYCNRQVVSSWLREHMESQREHGFRLWALLVLGEWLWQERTHRESSLRHCRI